MVICIVIRIPVAEQNGEEGIVTRRVPRGPEQFDFSRSAMRYRESSQSRKSYSAR